MGTTDGTLRNGPLRDTWTAELCNPHPCLDGTVRREAPPVTVDATRVGVERWVAGRL